VSVLVIVPCGRSKTWDRYPDAGPTRADQAYTGAPFVVNRAHAERFGDDWLILSAKYGFVRPETVIPGPYEVTFKRASTNPIGVEELRSQIKELGLDRYPLVIVLGGREYREITRNAFDGLLPRLVFPFAGLPIGKMMRATKQAIASGNPGYGPSVSG
jgi:hypothetical protein